MNEIHKSISLMKYAVMRNDFIEKEDHGNKTGVANNRSSSAVKNCTTAVLEKSDD